MKEIFLLLLFLVPCSINAYLVKRGVEMDFPSPTSLYVSIKFDTYLYVEIGEFNSGYLYFHIRDDSYGLKNINYCISTSNPLYDSTLSNCEPYVPLSHYNIKTSGNIKDYYYKVDINTQERRGRCVILKYQGTNPAGSLTARSSLSDLYSDTKSSSSTSTLPPFAIALLVISSVFSLVTLILVIYFICKIRKTSSGLSNDSSFPLVQNNNN